ncbi:MAG: DinB family protein [Deferribacteraceae bacterium]|jgi:hypothetical protein|nr:DinB family protein [Deferribacteraceae bacterium]
MVQVFINDFERFCGMLINQVDLCSDEVWTATDGKYPYWWHIMHSIAFTEIYSADADATTKIPYSMPEIMYSKEPENVLSKEGLIAIILDIRETARAYMKGMTDERFTEVNHKLSKLYGKETTQLGALIAILRHMCYHIGCCDTILRMHGIKGVY